MHCNLEICLSHDFGVRENPLYHLIAGIVQKSQMKYEECLKSFLTAMTICGFNHFGSSGSNQVENKPKSTETEENYLGLADQVTLFLEIISTYTLMNENAEANKLMQVNILFCFERTFFK